MTAYREGRRDFLRALGCGESNRDPLAEFAEQVVAALLGGQLATSRVQKGWDVATLAGDHVQVRYLTNPAGEWVNGHLVDFSGDCDRYALVVFEALDPKALIVFSRGQLGGVCAALGKRHGNQQSTLQLTQANYLRLVADPVGFAALGVEVIPLGTVR